MQTYTRLAAVVSSLLTFSVVSYSAADVWVERMLPVREHDFGKVVTGSKAVCRFAVRNIYQHEIELVMVRSSCGCTAPRIENARLKPGQVGSIVATLNTDTYSGRHSASLTLRATWNDNGVRRSGEAVVQVHGDVCGDVVVEPNAVAFDNVQHGKPHEQKVRLSSEGESAWRLENVLCNCDTLEVDVLQADCTADHIVYDLIVRLTALAPPGGGCPARS